MRAVHVTAHGDPSVLEVVELPRPEAGPGEVLLAVVAVSVNHLDLWVRRGMPGLPIDLPRIPGCDGIGEVVALGPGVEASERLGLGTLAVLEPGYVPGGIPAGFEDRDHLAPGYSIRGEHCDGFLAEYVTLPVENVLPLPSGVDPVRAAAAPLVFLTAWGMLHTRARVGSGESVLVVAGSSGVGSASIQLARRAGARVLATAGSDEKRALCAELGAEEVFDHSDPEWPSAARAATGGRGADVVVEHVGPATWSGALRCLAPAGRLVTCGATTGAKVSVVLPHLFIKNLSILGSTMGPRCALPEIFGGIASGELVPVVDRVMPMVAVGEAHERLEHRQVLGKIVLTP